MKTRSSLKGLKKRGNSKIVVRRRSGVKRIFVINKEQPKFKTRQ